MTRRNGNDENTRPSTPGTLELLTQLVKEVGSFRESSETAQGALREEMHLLRSTISSEMCRRLDDFTKSIGKQIGAIVHDNRAQKLAIHTLEARVNELMVRVNELMVRVERLEAK
jgi:hypothetical protein